MGRLLTRLLLEAGRLTLRLTLLRQELVKLRMLFRRVSGEVRMLVERDAGDDSILKKPDGLACSCGRYSDGGKSAIMSVASRRSASVTIRIVMPLTSLLLARYALAGGCRKESSSEVSVSVEMSSSTEGGPRITSFSRD